MTTYQVTLEGREEIADGTMAFRIKKPTGFNFDAGQAVALELIDPPPGDGQTRRTFSLVSAPFESALVVATRMRDSAFKRTLKTLPDGAGMKLEGPFGELILGDPARPAVFIAGGIGITPFMSMLRQATKDKSLQRLFLVYSNHRPEDAAFLPELQELGRQSRSFRLLATMTDMSKSVRTWDGETGSVNVDLLKRFVGDLSAPIYYVVGPPGMVEAMEKTLSQASVAEGNIRTEEFYGY